jgi:hypothetical protein
MANRHLVSLAAEVKCVAIIAYPFAIVADDATSTASVGIILLLSHDHQSAFECPQWKILRWT